MLKAAWKVRAPIFLDNLGIKSNSHGSWYSPSCFGCEIKLSDTFINKEGFFIFCAKTSDFISKYQKISKKAAKILFSKIIPN